jgi:carboxyl-terminal processing protease
MNNAFSFKLKTNQGTYGYIRIPSFYSTFENGKSNLSNDVALEVAKLQIDQVEGIIIDLENNGGGSMEEAVKLSGLFIESGPLAIMDNNKGKKEILKDTYKDAIYYGPMIIMINAFSASASEFFTNAMQDYNRAIIIGNKSLGKATMQRVFPLNQNNDEFLKITLEKFYRVTGKSNQYSGIMPNITIPALFDKQMPREDSMDTALRNDELKAGTKFNRIESDAYTRAIALSNQRMDTSAEAKYITDLNTKVAPFYDVSLPPILLQFDCVFEDVTKINTLWKTIKEATEKEYPIAVTQTETDLESQNDDAFLTSFTNERIKEVKQNFHILEAINILTDVNQNP